MSPLPARDKEDKVIKDNKDSENKEEDNKGEEEEEANGPSTGGTQTLD
jgi:hypothetical protein